MLLQFTVENFRSIREPVTLSCIAAPGVPHADGQVRVEDGHQVLRAVALYGANGSGKSNLVKALMSFLQLTTQGVPVGASLVTEPFALDPSCLQKPTRFAAIIAAGGRTYAYDLSILSGKIEEESLRLLVAHDETELFSRTRSGDTSEAVVISPELVSGERKAFLNFVAEGTRAEQPLLAEARARNVTELAELFRALLAISIVAPSWQYRNLALHAESDAVFLGFLQQVLRDADTGISSLSPRRVQLSPDRDERVFLQFRAGGLLSSSDESVIVQDGDNFSRVELVAQHETPAMGHHAISMREESDGTRRLLHLAPILFAAEHIKESQNISVVDELERSLHPLLTRNFIKRFLAAGSSALPQLIFTTHDVNLLDLTLLSVDSLWFTEKDASGATTLHSLSEFNPEQLEHFQRSGELEGGYLAGRFGGVPSLRRPFHSESSSPASAAASEAEEEL